MCPWHCHAVDRAVGGYLTNEKLEQNGSAERVYQLGYGQSCVTKRPQYNGTHEMEVHLSLSWQPGV